MNKKTNILQITNIDTFGNKFNGTNLAESLINKNINAWVYVWDKKTGKEFVHNIINLPGKKVLRKIFNIIEDWFSIQSLLYPFSFIIYFKKYFKKADLVHYHLIHTGFFSLFSLPFLTKNKPSVWTIHDPWAITGHCIYPYECKDYTKGCGRCKILNSPLKMKFDNTKLMWKIKKFIYKKTKINIIVASEYMYKIVKNNSLLKDKNIAIIPFGINLNVYKPKNQDNCKKKFNIDKDCFTIFFRSTKNEYKGLIYIQECLNKIFTTKKIAIITIDQKGLIDEFKDRFQIVELGWTQDDQTIADAYNACDVFLMPSTAEAFGLMAVEAMSCGKTVIAFKGTSLEEVLDAPYGGVVVSMKNSNELTKALELLIENPDVNKNIGKKALKIAQNRYDEKIYLEKTINFYEEILNE